MPQNIVDKLGLGQALDAYDAAEKAKPASVMDYVRAAGLSVSDVARGVGYGLETLGVPYGRRMREAGDAFAADREAGMTPGGREALTGAVVKGDGIADLSLGDRWGQSALMGVARSVPQMLITAPLGGALAAGGRALTGALAPKLVEEGAKGVAPFLAKTAPSAFGYGAVEGGQAGLQNAADIKTKIESTPIEALRANSPRFAELYNETADTLTPEWRGKIARTKLAEEAARDVAVKTTISTGAIGALTGGGALGAVDRFLERGARDGILKTALKGAATEAMQETPQSGGEAYIQNLAERRFLDKNTDPTKGVAAEALSGGIVGGLSGGMVGGAGAVAHPARAEDRGEEAPSGSFSDRVLRIIDRFMPKAPVEEPSATPQRTRTVVEPPPTRGEATASTEQQAQALRPAGIDTPLDHVQALDSQIAQLAQGPRTAQVDLQIDDLTTERNEIAKTFPQMVEGAPTSFSTESNVKLDGNFALAELEELQPSHDFASMRENPNYPQSLQPRDRSAAAYELQVQSLASKLNPERLGESADVANGAPIVGADGLVESGNGRTMAIAKAYDTEGEPAKRYRAWLRENAPRFGISPEAVDKFKYPVLVRVRQTPVNRAEFARQANAPTTAQMSPMDQARTDAKRMGSLEGLQMSEDGDVFTAANRDVVKGFFATLPLNEQTALVDPKGNITEGGQRRFLNALVVRAYGDHSAAVMRMVGSMNDDLRNLSKALVRVAPRVAQAQESFAAGALPADTDITPILISAVEELVKMRSSGTSVADALAQAGMFEELPEEAAMLITFLDQNIRAPRRIAQFIENYLDEIGKYGGSAVNDMFGGNEAPGKLALMRTAKEGLTDGDTASSTEAVPGGPSEAGAAPAGGETRPANAGPAEVPRAPAAGVDTSGQPERERRGEKGAEDGPVDAEDTRSLAELKAEAAKAEPREAAEAALKKWMEHAREEGRADVPHGLSGPIKFLRGKNGTVIVEMPRGTQHVFKEVAAQAMAPTKQPNADWKLKFREDARALAGESAEAGHVVLTKMLNNAIAEMPDGWDEKKANDYLESKRRVLATFKEDKAARDKKAAREKKPAKKTAPKGGLQLNKPPPGGWTEADKVPKKKPAAKPEPQPAPEQAPGFGDTNKVFTKDKADKARELLRRKLNQLNAGLDPEVVQAGIELAGYYIEGGARKFADYSARMLEDLGDAVRPYLKSWYAAVFYHPGFDATGMEEPSTITNDTANAPAKAVDSTDAQAESAGGDQIGATPAETAQIGEAFEEAAAGQLDGEQQITHVFDPPTKAEVVRLQDKVKVYTAEHGWLTIDQAKARIAEWKAHAAAQGKTGANSNKVVLSLFDKTGAWSQPWEDAGYQVYRFDIQDDWFYEEVDEETGEVTEKRAGDVTNFSTAFFNDMFGAFEGNDVHAVLAACPCTDFAVSGARHFAAKDADGRTVESVKLVHMTQGVVEFFKPAVWAIENPVGRIEKLTGLPPWRLSFDPNHLGDPYTKKTLLWGRFNADLPIAPVEPTEGSKMHQKYGGKSLATKNARSVTPEGFAYSFFMANNFIDHTAMGLANKYDRLDGNAIRQAVARGVTEEQIKDAVDDFYYFDLDDEAANKAVRALKPENGNGNGTRTVSPASDETAGQESAPAEGAGAEEEVSPVDEAAHQAATSPTNEEPHPSQAEIAAGNPKLGHKVISGMDVSFENPEGSYRTGLDRAALTKLVYWGSRAPGDESGPLLGKAGEIPINDALNAMRSPNPDVPKVVADLRAALEAAKARGDTTFVDLVDPILKGAWVSKLHDHYGYFKGTQGFDKDHLDVFVKPGTPENWTGTVFVVNQNKGNGRFDEHKVMLGYESKAQARAAYLSNYEKGWESHIRSIVPLPLDAFKNWAYDKTAEGPRGGPLGSQKLDDKIDSIAGIKVGDVVTFKSGGHDMGGVLVRLTERMAYIDVPNSRREERHYEIDPRTMAKAEGDVLAKYRETLAYRKREFEMSKSLGDKETASYPLRAEVEGLAAAPNDEADFKKTGIVKAIRAPHGGRYLVPFNVDRNAAGKVTGVQGWDAEPSDTFMHKPIEWAPGMAPQFGLEVTTEQGQKLVLNKKARWVPRTQGAQRADPDTRSDGYLAFMRGEPRTPPANRNDYYKNEWLRDWDDAQADAAQLPAKPGSSEPLKTTHPNVVVRDVRDFDGRKLGDIIEPYDGTEDGARAAARKTAVRMQDEFGGAASNINSRIGATDENGKPKWAISPNFANVRPVDSDAGQYIWGDLSKAPRTIGRPLKAGDKVRFKDGFNKRIYTVWIVHENGQIKIDEDAPKLWRPPGDFELVEARAPEEVVTGVEAAGRADFAKGVPRSAPPSYLTKPVAIRKWQKGWDWAKARAGQEPSGGGTIEGQGANNEPASQPPVQAGNGESDRGRGPVSGAGGGSVGGGLAAPGQGAGKGGKAGAGGARNGQAGSGDLFASPAGGEHPSVGSRDRPAVRPEPGTPASLAGDYTITPADKLGSGGQKAKYRDNIAAIQTLKAIQAEDRKATADEQKVLVRYVGWGGLKGVFDPENKDWAKEFAEVKELLSPDEYEAARRTILDAHYTSTDVIKGVYDLLGRLGFDHGRLLEPSVGTGNFIGLMDPVQRAKSAVTGVELDPTTGGIAKLLYPKADIVAGRGFEEVRIPEGYFDAAVGNPPFGSQAIHDPANPDLKFSLHNFFFAKTINSLRPGGVMAMVVSRYFLDAKDATAREWIAQRAKLLGAVRLPNTAFKQNAGTEVTTDIIVLQKLAEGEKPKAADWTKTGMFQADGQTAPVSKYFLDNPDNVLGRLALTGSLYGSGNEITVEPGDKPLADLLKAVVDKFPKGVYEHPKKRLEVLTDVNGIVPEGAKVGGYFVTPEGKIARRLSDVLGKKSFGTLDIGDTLAERIKAMVGVRDALTELMRAEMTDGASLGFLRQTLNSRYDAFVKKYGFINGQANRNAFAEDPSLPLLEALETDYDRGIGKAAAEKQGVAPRAATAGKAAIFAKRVLQPYRPVTSAESPKDALVASLNERGAVDLPYMAQLLGRPVAGITEDLGDLIFQDPESGWVTADEYLSGNVKAKLAQAKAAGKGYERNVDALQRVQPIDIDPADIVVRIGTPWIPANDVADFAQSILEVRPDLSYQKAIARWFVDFKGPVNGTNFTTKWGTGRMHAGHILDALLNTLPIEVKDNIGSAREPQWVMNEPETRVAQAKADEMAQAFRDWIWQDQARRDRLARFYNDTFNTDVQRQYDGSHLSFPGMSPNIQLRPHQKAGVWRIMQERGALLDQVVGAGKTYEIVAAVMEMRRIGTMRKPILPVPNHLVRQWRDEFYKLYPNANILAATEKDFEKGNRQRLFGRIATGDWDAVIVGHSSFKKIGMPAEEEKAILEEMISDIAEAIEQIKREKGDKNVVKDMERIKANLQAKIASRASRTGKKDEVATLDELGADGLFVDEAHAFKNLFYTTRMRGIAGLGSPDGSGRAFDLFVKMRWLKKQKGVGVFATGTPVSNSLVEMFTMQRYMMYDEMKDMGIHLLDGWARTFGDVQAVYEVHPSGNGYRLKQRFAKFVNIPELMKMYKGFADVVTLADLKQQAKDRGERFPVPKVKGGKPQLNVAPRSQLQTTFFGVPEFARDEKGNIQFESNDLRVLSMKEWAPLDNKNPDEAPDNVFVVAEFGMGKPRIDRNIGDDGRFTDRDEAAREAERLMNTPKSAYNEGSILWKFENLKRLNKESDGRINALSITNEARKAALDFRLIDPKAPDFKDSKVNRAVKEIKRVYDAWQADKGTQLVFCDLSVPASAVARAQAKPQKLFVRDVDGKLVKREGALKLFDEHPGRVFILAKTGSTVAVFDAVTGTELPVDAGKDRREAGAHLKARLDEGTTWLDEALADAHEITDADIEDWKAENAEAVAAEEEAGDESVSLEDIANMAEGAARFSVYDDLKAKLIEAGIPANEVAFIHDYDTSAKKQAAYQQVRRGEIRVLLGSTEKMGAGMNVQDRLVGLHHLDAPWRPSDLEQREGRIIRQGNQLYQRDPDGFEVEIHRYATEKTYDTRMWQIIEHKANGVEQLRKAGADVRTLDDVGGEAANAADMKAAASGNPLILEEIKLRNDLKTLDAKKKEWARSRWKLESDERYLLGAPEREQRKLADLRRWIDARQPKGEKFSIEIDGFGTLTEKKDAAGPLMGFVAQVLKGDHKDTIEAGKYRGIYFGFKEGWNEKSVKAVVSVDGRDWSSFADYDMDKPTEHFSATGFIQRLDNMLDGLEGAVPRYAEERARDEKELGRVRGELAKPFNEEERLIDVRKKHRAVAQKLASQGGALDLTPKMKAELDAALARRAEARAERTGNWEGRYWDAQFEGAPSAEEPSDFVFAGAMPFANFEGAAIPPVRVKSDLKRSLKLRDEGVISDATFVDHVRELLGAITSARELREYKKVAKERTRGEEWVRERLLRARRQGDLSAESVDFALWLLDKAPWVADDLGISVRSSLPGGVSGQYNPFARVAAYAKHSRNAETGVHEILHHTERMMPPEVQQGITAEYGKQMIAAFLKGTAAERQVMEDMVLAQAGDTKAYNRMALAFKVGKVDPSLYQFANPSEFWAVNATRILAGRYEGNWVAKAKQWLRELVHRIKGFFGARGDAAVLKGLRAVLTGDGAFLSKSMLVELVQARFANIEPPAEGMSRNRASTSGLPMRDVQAVVASVRRALPGAPPIHVHEKINKAPKALIEFIRAAGAEHDVEAAFHQGEIHVFPENIASVERAEFVIGHHEIRHYGLRALLGPKLDGELHRIYAQNAAVKAGADAKISRDRLDRASAVEEVLADMPLEAMAKLTGIERFIAAIRDGLRALAAKLRAKGLHNLAAALEPSEWTDNDVLALVVRAEAIARDGNALFRAGGTALSDDGTAPTFYSELARQLEGAPLKAAPAKAWKDYIKSLKGVKADEVQWSGISEWLDLQDTKVTKAQVLGFLAENGVKVEEELLGGSVPRAAVDRIRAWLEDTYGEADENATVTPEDLEDALRGDANAIGNLETAGVPGDLLEPIYDSINQGASKFGQYQLPGGTNYRELLLTLPQKEARFQFTKEQQAWADYELELNRRYGDRYRELTTIDERLESRRLRDLAVASRPNGAMGHGGMVSIQQDQANFQSPHFDPPNVLAHVRFNERTDADGKRVLFIEELQSDWAQAGRKQGFRDDAARDLPPGYVVKGMGMSWWVEDTAGNMVNPFKRPSREEAIGEAIHGRSTAETMNRNVKAGTAIPAAPFVTKTEAWVGLALKRMIRYAAENGFDRVAWTTGAQQIERYPDALRQVVDRIVWHKVGDREGTLVTGMKAGREVFQGRISTTTKTFIDGPGAGKPIEEVLGKGMAEKVLAEPAGAIEGKDFAIGGKGMQDFYDKIVPNVANGILKRVGGNQVATVKLGKTEGADLSAREVSDAAMRYIDAEISAEELIEETGIDSTPVEIERELGGIHRSIPRQTKRDFAQAFARTMLDRAKGQKKSTQPGFDITPALRERVLKGLPLFSRAIRQEGFPAGLGEPLATLPRPYVAANLKGHPDYKAAKSGDREAAVRYVRDMVTPENLEEARNRFGSDVIFVAPTAMEAAGLNAIPDTMAAYYAQSLGARMDTGIIQTNKAFHTGAGRLERLVARALFDGPVEKGADYVLVDDVMTMGGTLAELADHIRAGGGNVVGVVVLSHAGRSGKLAPSQRVVQRLERRFGDEIRQELNVEPSALTADEALAVDGLRDADDLRTRAAEAREAHARRLSEAQVPGAAPGVTRLSRRTAGETPEMFPGSEGVSPHTPDGQRQAEIQMKHLMADALTSSKTFNWWHRTVGTQYHKANLRDANGRLLNPGFKKVFDTGQRFLIDVSRFAMQAEAHARSLLHRIETFSDVDPRKLYRDAKRDREDVPKVAEALFAGTLAGGDNVEAGRVWTNGELRRKFGLNDRQIQTYDQARAAVDESLEQLGKSTMARLGLTFEIPSDPDMSMEDTAAILTDALRTKIEDMTLRIDGLADRGVGAGLEEDKRAAMRGAIGKIDQIAKRVKALQAGGYMPLMRFGEYAVDVVEDVSAQVGEEGYERKHFAMYDTETEANAAARALKKDFPNARVTVSPVSKEAYKIFNGISPDTIEVFAEITGLEEHPLMQEYFQEAVSNRSALKRMIERKAVPGYDKDVQRVLAQFIASNARATSANYHHSVMLDAVTTINEGDVKDEAYRLYSYLNNPQEEAAALRGYLFFHFLGGSAASALVNMTQPVLMSAPYLHQFADAATVTAELARAMKEAAKGDYFPPDQAGQAMRRALDEGVVAPHEIHQLMATARGGVARSKVLTGITRVWGGFFSLAESWNRKSTFLAAYRIALANGDKDPYGMAVKAVEETQGIYNRGNRPNWARGTIGATVFTFKQFSVAYLEFLKRLPQAQRGVALAILFLAAGLNGLPGADDLDDILDTFGQWLGFDTNMKRHKRELIEGIAGQGVGQWVLNGASAIPGMPLDVQARLGLGNLLPGTGFFKPSNADHKTRDAMEFLGPVGGIATAAGDTLEKAAKGNFGAAAKAMLPTALANAAKGMEMFATGKYKDSKGRLVTDADGLDAMVKAVGFQPAHIAEQSRRISEIMGDVSLHKVVEAGIADRWANAIADLDTEGMEEARQEMLDWNRSNPDMPIKIDRSQLAARVKAIRMTREQRTLKTTPREIRARMQEAMTD